VVVFTAPATLRKLDKGEWEISIPLRCQNLAGAVEVLVEGRSELRTKNSRTLNDEPDIGSEMRQLTGCTSPKTTVTFLLGNSRGETNSGFEISDIYVLDSWGSVLARADLPRTRR
jgi:hypothetical protein